MLRSSRVHESHQLKLNRPEEPPFPHESHRFWRRVWIRILYLVMLIVCAIIVSALSSQTRVDLNRSELNLNLGEMRSDVGQAAALLPTGVCCIL